MELGGDQAVQIVRFDSEAAKAFLDDEMLATILSRQEEIEQMPTIVISIGGVARSGKSFLLNLFVSYLSYLEKNGSDSGWEVSESPVEGVNWAQSKTAVTFGIWMWNKPFVITRSDGSKAAVLLVDSQGTGDHTFGDAKVDTLIMYISLQISSAQVPNVKSYLNSNEMTSLQLCADYAEVGDVDDKVEGEDDYLFQSLMFVVRDYQGGDDIGEDSDLFPRIVRDVKNPELKSVVLGIRKAFRSISAYNFPHPGFEFTKASSTSHTWLTKDIPEMFLKLSRELIRDLCSLREADAAAEQRCCCCWLSARELLVNFQMLKFHLENDDLPPITNPADALQDTILYRAYVVAQKEFASDVLKFTVDWITTFTTENALREDFESETRNALEMFRKVGKHRKYSKSDIWKKYEDMLADLFETTYSGIKTNYEVHIKIQQLQECQTTLCQQMEQQTNQFHQQVAELNEQLRKTELEQAEAAQRSAAMMDSLNIKFAKLQMQNAEDVQVKVEIERKLEQYRKEALEREKRAEKDKERTTRKMDVLRAQFKDSQAAYEKAKEETEAKLAEKTAEKSKEKNNNAGSSQSPKNALFEMAIATLLGAFQSGATGALKEAFRDGASYLAQFIRK